MSDRNALTWAHLLEHDPSKRELFLIMAHGTNIEQVQAADKMLGRNLLNSELCSLLHLAPEERKTFVWGRLMDQCPSNDDFRHVITSCTKQWSDKAAEELLNRDPDIYDLYVILEYAFSERLKVKAVEGLLKKDLSDIQLESILEIVPSCFRVAYNEEKRKRGL